MKRQRSQCEQGGFTLVEVLITIAVVSVLSSLAYVTYTSLGESSREAKLESDVVVVNQASRLYLADGGSFSGEETVEEVINKLKSSATAQSAESLAGMTGSFIDRRVKPVFLDASEAESSKLRAHWDSVENQFVVSREGTGGVLEFQLQEDLALADYQPEERSSSVQYASETAWVWDFEDMNAAETDDEFSSPGLPATQRLASPVFDPPGGSLPLSSFDPEITLSNPNPEGSSTIFYTTGGSQLAEYHGESITVSAGGRVVALAVSLNPSQWLNSAVSSAQYNPIPLQLAVALQDNPGSLTYAAAGGPMKDGSEQTPSTVKVVVTNANTIPEAYRTSDGFEVYFTTDGSDPLDPENPSAQKGPPFDQVFIPPEVDISISNWGGQSSFPIRAAARAKNTALFVDSAEASANITIAQTTLSAPVIDPPSQTIVTDLIVSVEDGPGYPEGRRVMFTLNGQDPGWGNNPVQGNVYTEPFTVGPGLVTMRTYGPAAYSQWFISSPLVNAYYSEPSVPAGALVASASIFGSGTFVGNLTYAAPPAGQNMQTIAFYSDTVVRGNLYLPGLPNLYVNWEGPSQRWSHANDAIFAPHIWGNEYTENGLLVDPSEETAFPRVKQYQPPGPTTPVYNVFFYGNSVIEGKVFRQYNIGVLPSVDPPIPKNNNNTVSYSSWDFDPANPNPAPPTINPNQYANVNLNTNLAHIPFQPGSYGAIAASSNSSIILGDPDNPDVVQEYHFQSLSLTGGADLVVVGKVKITMSSTMAIHNGAVVGNPDHPDWLQINFYSTATPSPWWAPRLFHSTGDSQFYGAIVAPNGEVALDGESVFQGGVTAYKLQITSNSVLFLLPPVIAP